jgi:LDH2 family malate/lactate/ureidoglycolate dehydrogenase
MDENRRFYVNKLHEFIKNLFEKAGLNNHDSGLLVKSYIDNNLRGIDSHGVRLVPNCINRLKAGGINPRPAVKVETETLSTARLNGDNGLGQIVGMIAMDMAIKKAENTGNGFVIAANTNNAGAMSTYTMIALEKGMVGLCMATTIPSMFAWGGLKRVIANPPISIAFPSRKTPFILDICLGSVAYNKIYMMKDKNLPIPEGWAWDRNGHTTTDPAKASQGGSVIPIGGHKGYGLSIVIELLTAIIGGCHFGTDMKGLFENPSEGEGITMTVSALNVSKLLDEEILHDRVETLFEFIKSSPLMNGFAKIMIPGEPEEEMKKERTDNGIPLPAEVIKSLKDCSKQLGVKFIL